MKSLPWNNNNNKKLKNNNIFDTQFNPSCLDTQKPERFQEARNENEEKKKHWWMAENAE